MKIRQRFVLLPSVAALSVLGGCAGMPPYQPGADDVMVPIKLFGDGRPQMCKDGRNYSLATTDTSDTVKVPSGQRISLGAFMQYDGYNVIYTCRPALSFVPRPGQAYVANTGLNNNRCFIELVREDLSKDTGVAFEPSLAAASCTAGTTN